MGRLGRFNQLDRVICTDPRLPETKCGRVIDFTSWVGWGDAYHVKFEDGTGGWFGPECLAPRGMEQPSAHSKAKARL